MDITVTIGFITGMVTFLIGYATFMKSRDKDNRSDAKRDAIIETKIDMIANNIDTIRLDQKDSNIRIGELSEHLIRTDERVKQAHERIDRMEEKFD